MGYPVVHFEVLTDGDAGELQNFYAETFGWKIDADNPQKYGLVETGSDKGIPGGIAAAQQGPGMVTVYVMVPDIDATLAKAESLGAKTLMPKSEVTPEVTLAIMSDPHGHVIGLTQGE
ncbi:MAG: uncharacterized protein QOG54_932 [Actinomycetota bacterium]|jgi:predicted enzyme related to lactoylglutathione lyase|nr:uncharacterized protein [Actinomycetota bacterium]